MQKKFLVTGGAGFIGTNLVHFLMGEGYDVVVVDDLSAGMRERLPDTVTFHRLDVCDTPKLADLLKDIDTVFHLAALPSVQFSIEHPEETHRVNVDGTLSVLEAARVAGVRRVVFTSSAAVFGDVAQFPTSEDAPTHPKSPYGLHKLIGEQLMKLWSELYDLETVSLRLFNVYGPYMDPDGAYAAVVGRFLKLRSEHKPLTIVGSGEQTRDFVHVEDVARAFLAAARIDAVGGGDIFNIGSGEEITVKRIAEIIGGTVEHLPPRVEPMRSLADTRLAKEKLAWVPQKDFMSGIEALQEHPTL